MNPLVINGTEVSLEVRLDKAEGIFHFLGKSRPENVVNFFEPVFSWFEEYGVEPNQETNILFKLEYFNSSSAKVLLRLLVLFEEIHAKGNQIKVSWFYHPNDEDMLESGEDFASLVDVPFEFFEFN